MCVFRHKTLALAARYLPLGPTLRFVGLDRIDDRLELLFPNGVGVNAQNVFRSGSLHQKVLPDGFGDGLRAILDAQFILRLLNMGSHGLLAQFEVLCDFLERLAE